MPKNIDLFIFDKEQLRKSFSSSGLSLTGIAYKSGVGLSVLYKIKRDGVMTGASFHKLKTVIPLPKFTIKTDLKDVNTDLIEMKNEIAKRYGTPSVLARKYNIDDATLYRALSMNGCSTPTAEKIAAGIGWQREDVFRALTPVKKVQLKKKSSIKKTDDNQNDHKNDNSYSVILTIIAALLLVIAILLGANIAKADDWPEEDVIMTASIQSDVELPIWIGRGAK